MSDTPSSILLTREQSTGSNTNLWGGYLITTQRMTEQAMKAVQSLVVTGDATISWTNYATGNTGQAAVLRLTGSLTSAATLTFPAYYNRLLVTNSTGKTVTIKCSGGTGVAIPTGSIGEIFCDTVDYYSAGQTWLSTYTNPLTNSGDIVVKTTLEAAIAAASLPATAGTILVDASDTTAGYIGGKFTVSLGGLTTTQVAGLTSLQLSVKNSGGNEKLKVSSSQGYVGGFLNGGVQSAQFTPVVGTAYDVDCTSAGVTVNLGGMTTPQVGQEIKLNNFGTKPMFLLGTVNGLTNLAVSAPSNGPLRYTGATWGWN